jgi:hypothetical protein
MLGNAQEKRQVSEEVKEKGGAPSEDWRGAQNLPVVTININVALQICFTIRVRRTVLRQKWEKVNG